MSTNKHNQDYMWKCNKIMWYERNSKGKENWCLVLCSQPALAPWESQHKQQKSQTIRFGESEVHRGNSWMAMTYNIDMHNPNLFQNS